MAFIAATGPHAGQVEVEGDLVTMRERSVLLKAQGRVVWLPRSKITIEAALGARVTVWMPKWLAREIGFV